MGFIESRFQMTTPTELQKSVGGNLCLLRCIYTFADSRGRLSLQEKLNFLMRTSLYAEAFDFGQPPYLQAPQAAQPGFRFFTLGVAARPPRAVSLSW